MAVFTLRLRDDVGLVALSFFASAGPALALIDIVILRFRSVINFGLAGSAGLAYQCTYIVFLAQSPLVYPWRRSCSSELLANSGLSGGGRVLSGEIATLSLEWLCEVAINAIVYSVVASGATTEIGGSRYTFAQRIAFYGRGYVGNRFQ